MAPRHPHYRHPPRKRLRLTLLKLLVPAVVLYVWWQRQTHGAGAAAASLAAWLGGARGGGGGTGGVGLAPGACPLRYERMLASEVGRHGAKPYLFGGRQRPRCKNCHSKEEWAQICQFKAGQLCPLGMPAQITDNWYKRQYHLPLTLMPCDFWKYFHNRTVFLMGDSMMLDFYKARSRGSLKCFMYEFWDLKHYPVTEDEALQAEITFVEAVPPDCVRMPQNSRICYIRLDKGYDQYQKALPLFPRLARPSDLLVANFGLHHWLDYEETLANFTAYVAAHRPSLPMLFWQQTSQQHFLNDEGSGEYPGGEPPFKCAAIANFSVVGTGSIRLHKGKSDPFQMLTGNWRNTMADRWMRKAGIAIVPSFNETLWMSGMHRDNGAGLECTHYCHPSAPQTWVVALFRALDWVDKHRPHGYEHMRSPR